MKKLDMSQDFSGLKKIIDQLTSVTNSIFQLVGWIVLTSGLFYSYLKFAKPQDNDLFLWFYFFCIMLCIFAGTLLISKFSIFFLEKVFGLIERTFRNKTLIKLFQFTAFGAVIIMLGALMYVFVEIYNSINDLAARQSQNSIDLPCEIVS